MSGECSGAHDGPVVGQCEAEDMTEPEDLIPELRAWNDGGGVNLLSWLNSVAQSDVAIGYAELFWPRFVVFERYVLRRDFSLENLRGWETAPDINRRDIEWFVNCLDVGSLFFRGFTGEFAEGADHDLLDQRVLYIRDVLKATYTAKLKLDFPDRAFEVVMIEDEDEIAMTFCQV